MAERGHPRAGARRPRPGRSRRSRRRPPRRVAPAPRPRARRRGCGPRSARAGPSRGGMRARLRRGEHVGAGLDRAGAQQHLPVRRAGRHGEGRGHGQHLRPGLGEIAVEARESAGRSRRSARAGGRRPRRPPPGRPAGRRRIRGSSRRRRARRRTCGSCRSGRGSAPSGPIRNERLTKRPSGSPLFRQSEPMTSQSPSSAATARSRASVASSASGDQHRALAGAVGGDDVGAFRRQRQRGAAGGRLAHQRLGDGEVGGRVVAGAELDQRRPHRSAVREHRVEPAGPVELVDLVEAADVLVADEDLRHRAPAARAG